MTDKAFLQLIRLWQVALSLAAVAAAWALGVMLRIPSEAASAWLLGFSKERLAPAALSLLPGLVFAVVALAGWRQPARLEPWIERTQVRLQSRPLFWALLAGAVLLLV